MGDPGTVIALLRLNDTLDPFTFTLGEQDNFGGALASLGDVDGNGNQEYAIGAPGDFQNRGAVWIYSPFPSRSPRLARAEPKRVVDLAVGAEGDGAGAVWVLFLEPSGRIQARRRIDAAEAGFVGGAGLFGTLLLPIGDLDLDGVVDLVAGDSRSQSNPSTRVLFLARDGSVKTSRLVDRSLIPGTTPNSGFGRLVADLGPRANGGRILLLTNGSQNHLWRVELDASGQVGASLNVPHSPVFTIASPGDLNGDGHWDLASSQLSSFGARILLEMMDENLGILSSSTFQGGSEPLALTAIGDATGDGVPDLAGTTALGTGRTVFLAQLGGYSRMDFELGDTVAQSLNEDGRALPPGSWGYTLGLTSLGANLGPAAFDSTPGGPNAVGQDPDLLVGSGRVLILQDSLQGLQTEPGIFDRPNDDADGGTFVFVPRRPVRPLSVRLIDVDPGAGEGGTQGATMVLFDQAGRRRTFDIPAGFTEDRILNGGSGWRRLDLQASAPQPGFQASATSVQETGFDAGQVVRIEVTLGSSGAIDALVYDAYP